MSDMWECPYCGNEKPSPNGMGTDVACCGEIGHAIRATENGVECEGNEFSLMAPEGK